MFNDFSENTLRKKSGVILFQIVAISIIVMAGVGVLAIKFSNGLYSAARLLFGKIDSVCGCMAGVTFLTHPWLFSGLLLGGLLLAGAFIFALRAALGLCVRTRRFVRYNLKRRKENISEELLKVSGELGISDRVIEIESKEPIVFCYGFRQPKICVSGALIQSLDENELAAVLAHEKFHMNAREPAKLFIVKTIALIFFFIPVIKSLSAKYITFSELAADEAATAGFTNKIPLAQALNKIICWQQRRALSEVFALSFFSSVTEERVRRLTDDAYAPSSVWATKKILAGVFCFMALFVGVNSFLSSRVIQDSLASHSHLKTCGLAQTHARTSNQDIVCEQKESSDNCDMMYFSAYQGRC